MSVFASQTQTAPHVLNRIAANFMLRCLTQVGALYRGNAKHGIALLAIAQASGHANTLAKSERPVGIRAMSESLYASYETTRRYVAVLTQADLCKRTSTGGVAIAVTDLAQLGVARLRAEVLHRYVQMLSELKSVGVEFPDARGIPDGDDILAEKQSHLAVVASNFLLRLLEVYLPLFDGNLTTAAIWTTIFCESVANITYDKELTWKFGGLDDLPPDDLRCALSAMAISRRLGMSSETTRRHIALLTKRGLCERVSHTGYVLPRALERLPHILIISQLSAVRLFQSLEELSRGRICPPC